jgi:hypothetical protein
MIMHALPRAVAFYKHVGRVFIGAKEAVRGKKFSLS